MVLRAARLRWKISQQAIADRLSVTRTAVGLWETDRNAPSTENLISICQLYHIDLEAASRGELKFVNGYDDYHATLDGAFSETVDRKRSEVGSQHGLIADDDVVPLYMTVAAPEMDYFFITERPSLMLGRPADAPKSESIYMLAIMDSKMEPDYKKLSMVYVDARGVPRIGDDVIIRAADFDRFSGSNLNAFDMQKCYFGRLEKYDPEHLTIAHTNPRSVIRIASQQAMSIHKVVRTD
ncbi:helix-turn-helix transcriptional regulator [Methylobacterium sp. 275MFSha3.1]|uniref:helix-turn-helix transcriptional regulator n=1 Tax=Methylobacterium sp. 275MFSha3.1 TaxID=1502746 RepID=UPI001481931E|nr:helix-turn-helix transcriptional regulator [Methylobacterium sp. 275MFSha3.1]